MTRDLKRRRGDRLAEVRNSSGRVVCVSCVIAETPRTRMRGLLGRGSLASGEGILIRPARAIHTLFMRFPIDVIFLDQHGQVVKIVAELAPWRGCVARRGRA